MRLSRNSLFHPTQLKLIAGKPSCPKWLFTNFSDDSIVQLSKKHPDSLSFQNCTQLRKCFEKGEKITLKISVQHLNSCGKFFCMPWKTGWFSTGCCKQARETKDKAWQSKRKLETPSVSLDVVMTVRETKDHSFYRIFLLWIKDSNQQDPDQQVDEKQTITCCRLPLHWLSVPGPCELLWVPGPFRYSHIVNIQDVQVHWTPNFDLRLGN